MARKILTLSHFDFQYGPQIILKAPKSTDDEALENIPALMDLYEKGFFIHMFGNFKSANLIFEIPSEYARGTQELLLISFLIDVNSDINLNVTKELLKKFASKLKDIKNVYKAFHKISEDNTEARVKFEEVKSLFKGFYDSFPEESIVIKRKAVKIFVYGLSQAGKTTIINTLQKSVSKSTLPTTNVNISRVVVNDLSILTYDAPGQSKFHDLWMPYLKDQNALVFVLDLADKAKYEHASKVLHKVAEKKELKNLPLLILLNKVDIAEVNVDEVLEELHIDKFENRAFKYYLTSGLTNQGIEEAFDWLSKILSNKKHASPTKDVGLIFSQWDEIDGLRITSVYPEKIFDDPEVIAIRCFSISQFIFGGEKFRKISVILPFTHLNSKAAIYFDYVKEENVRGGILPLSLIIFYNEDIPRAIIDKFNKFVFDKFEFIKDHYSDSIQVKNDLKTLHKKILERLKSFKPTVKALRLAEMRYQSLFKAARDAILIIDRNTGIIVDANKQAESLLNIDIEEIIGLHSSQIQLNNERADFLNQILNQVKLKNHPPIEMKIKNRNESETPVEVNANIVHLGGENLIQSILRDITERKQAERKLKESENKFRHLFEHSPFAIVLLSLEGVIVDCNPATKDLLGYNKDEIVHRDFTELSIVHPDYIEPLLEIIQDVLNNKEAVGMDVQLYRKDHTKIWANIQSSLVKIREEKFIQIIGNDITEKKKAEISLRESEQRFHKAYDRANFYKELFANDMNNILNNIQTSIQLYSLYKDDPNKKEERDEILDIIKEQSINGMQLISNIRKLSYLEESDIAIEKINIYYVLNEAIEKIYSEFPNKTLNLEIDIPNKDLCVLASTVLIDVFENLLIYEIKYNDDPVIEIKIKVRKKIENNENYLRIDFREYGLGIIDADQEKMFQRDNRGMLLRLSLVDEIINSFNGQIWVEKGDFVILLPEANEK
ncbi:MAG: putative Histidine kinase [Promethearchaeota archaeon]|nr:MAG: putative Histidine kinase [Candidatus Lokiarchaeota archaeon]